MPCSTAESSSPSLPPPDCAAPLIVALHGARGGADGIMRVLIQHADRIGSVVLAPSSAGPTWDIIATIR